jgi:hypothetical protein
MEDLIVEAASRMSSLIKLGLLVVPEALAVDLPDPGFQLT